MRVNVVDLDDALTKNFIKFCCVELHICPSSISVKGRSESLQNNATGYCYEVNCEDKYFITIAKKDKTVTEIYTALAHEMIQIKKFMEENNSITHYDSAHIVKKYVDNLYNVV